MGPKVWVNMEAQLKTYGRGLMKELNLTLSYPDSRQYSVLLSMEWSSGQSVYRNEAAKEKVLLGDNTMSELTTDLTKDSREQ